MDEEDLAIIAVLTATMKKMRTLAVKFSNVGKLKTGLHSAQEADGIKRELDTIKSDITRWNGHYLGLMRNIQLKHHILHVLETQRTMNVMKTQACADITPSQMEWTLAAETTVVLEPAFKATQMHQGVNTCPPNKACSWFPTCISGAPRRPPGRFAFPCPPPRAPRP